jgi:RNA polymerase sigma factor (sigma-70 family)
LTQASEVRIDPAAIAALHREHAEELRYFILGMVRDPELTAEVLQNAFARAMELGHTVRQESLKAWLFRVAYNEALASRRRQAIGERVVRNWASQIDASRHDTVAPASDAEACRSEAIAAVRQALNELSCEQRQVVRMRMYEQKRFVEIAEELKVPLGTVLSRMQLALKRLRKSLSSHGEEK